MSTPASTDTPSGGAPDLALLDLVHLDRQTMGDAGLRSEVLQLMLAELDALLPQIAAQEGPTRRDLAHRLKGAARGVGAFALGAVAERIERGPDRPGLVAELEARAQDLRAFVAALMPSG